jgi:glycosyltransferase involved in cell wall biosynthesis
MSARADLHVHSKHSNRPPEWILKQFGAPESYMEPREVYRRCRARGMQFVTVSDHDSVAGALEIAHLPGTFLSEEITVSFPEDGCDIHCLAWGISEEQHRRIQELRGNIYELRDYLVDEDILHACAHPLYRVNDRLTLAQFEKLIVLFNRFEGRNGIHDRRLNELACAIVRGLTEDMVLDLAERHRLTPVGTQPWVKSLSGGSDDHGGVYVGTTYTETPPAATVAEFLGHLRAGQHRPGGETGSTLRLAQSLYTIGDVYWKRRFPFGLGSRLDPFGRLLRDLARPKTEPRRRWTFLGGSLPASSGERSTFQAANGATQRALDELIRDFRRAASRGQISLALGKAAERIMPLVISMAPYLVALQTQHKDADLLTATARRFLGADVESALLAAQAKDPEAGPSQGSFVKKAWFTDTLTEVNGVATTIRTLTRRARDRGLALVPITSGQLAPQPDLPAREFRPLARAPLPGYPTLSLSLPPLAEILDHCERERYREILISTPGPVGLCGLLAAKLLGIPAVGFYHTDFPLYLRHLAGSATAEQLARQGLRWFYGAMDRVLVASRCYRDALIDDGYDPARLALLPRGVDLAIFNPERRDDSFWERGSTNGAGAHPLTFLYVGRISPEKNLPALLEAFAKVQASGRPCQLAIVGDGPQRAALERRSGPNVLWTGFLVGDELAKAYASADVFVFPSLTDTFGNAVLEAQASGLPAIVSQRGGPREIVEFAASGLVVNLSDPLALAAAMMRLQDDRELRVEMSERALAQARRQSWDRLLDRLWHEGPSTPFRIERASERPVRTVAESALWPAHSSLGSRSIPTTVGANALAELHEDSAL